MANDSKNNFHVIIVGSGPAGLILCLLLAKKGIRATILEKNGDIDHNPRASHYSAPTIHELRRAGLMEDIMKDAFVPDAVAWRLGSDPDKVLCEWDSDNKPGDENIIALPLDQLLPLAAKHLARYPAGEVKFHHEVISIGQDEHKAWVNVKTPDGEKRLEADYIAGCDGANSKIRRELLGDSFPGFTWDKQIVATNCYYPGYDKYKWAHSTFQISPEHFPMIAQITKDGMLRITYGEKTGLTYEEMRERQAWKYKQFVPGAPEPSEYKIVNFSPYRIHQRCVEKMRVGRFALAADAAHLCNPFGGMGLTGGLVDAGNLFDCLYGIATGELDDSILDKYSEVRIEKYQEIINKVSSANIKRLWDASPEAIENDPWFQAVARAKKDPEFEAQLKGSQKGVMHDFTQYYKSNVAKASA